jgi:hypothetical protein
MEYSSKASCFADSAMPSGLETDSPKASCYANSNDCSNIVTIKFPCKKPVLNTMEEPIQQSPISLNPIQMQDMEFVRSVRYNILNDESITVMCGKKILDIINEPQHNSYETIVLQIGHLIVRMAQIIDLVKKQFAIEESTLILDNVNIYMSKAVTEFTNAGFGEYQITVNIKNILRMFNNTRQFIEITPYEFMDQSMVRKILNHIRDSASKE